MKVLLINGSPRKSGNTYTALSEIAETLRSEGIDSEIVWIGNKPVRGCIACGKCKVNDNGRCVFDDDVCNSISAKFAEADGFAGRDFTSVPEAVVALFREIRARLDAIKPGLLIEFRQHYIGPAIRSFGNMLRASDCPASPCANRARIANLRLTSGVSAVHSDMLEWHPAEPVETAASQVLACLFGVIQYSMRLAALPADHREMVRHWLRFTAAHRGALLHGGFLAHGAAAGYTCLEGWDDRERIVAAYAPDTVCTINDTNRTAYVVNATPRGSVPLRLSAAPASVEIFDTCGRALAVPPALPGPGLCELAIPSGGYAVLRW